MITTAILNAIWGVVSPLLDKIPDMQINYDGIANSGIFQYLRAALYFIPTHTVYSIGVTILFLWILRVIIALLHSLWDALPIV